MAFRDMVRLRQPPPTETAMAANRTPDDIEELFRWQKDAQKQLKRMREEIDWCCDVIDQLRQNPDLDRFVKRETLRELRGRIRALQPLSRRSPS